jgi:predicted DNA-binding transcriptional regulator AlpA
VRTRYGGISDMTLWRWLRDLEMKFPPPVMIRRRRYWREADLADFDRRAAGAEAA